MNDQFVVGGHISGDLPLELVPSRPAAFVFGVEYRKETGESADPESDLRTGNSIGFGSATPVDAQINVKEVYRRIESAGRRRCFVRQVAQSRIRFPLFGL